MSTSEQPGPPPAVAPPRRQLEVESWPLLEREDAARVLEEAVAAARAGTGRAVLVRGSAGLGKTRLLDLAGRLGRDAGVPVLRAGGSVLERDFPFGVVFRLLEGRLRGLTEDERARVLDGGATLAAPVLLGGQPVEQALAAGSDASLLYALQRVVVNLTAEHPLVLAVDDLHWADALSIRLFLQLAAQVTELGLCVVGATRPREPGSRTDLLDQLAAQGNVRVLHPRALSVAASETLVRGAAARDDAFVRACAEQTGGNPLLLRELLRALEAEGVEGTDADVARVEAIGPEAIGYGVAATLARLGPACAALATAVAVLADDGGLRQAAALAELDDVTATGAAAALQDAGLFDDTAAAPRFRHPLLRRAVYDRPAAAARAALHRRAARLLDGHASAQDVASHLLLAPGAGERWAVEALREAARQASALAGHDAASRLLRRALLEPPEPADRPAVLEEAARAATSAGAEDAVPALRAAIEASRDGRARARLRLAQSRALYQQGAMRESADAADAGLAELGDVADEESLALELQATWSASTVWTPGGHAAVAERSAAVVAGDGPARSHGERELLGWLAGVGLTRGEDREGTVSLARRAWAEGAYLRESSGDAAGMAPMVSALLRAGALQESLGVLDELAEDARRRASPFDYAAWRSTRGNCLLHLGRLAEAESDLEEALEARALGWKATAPMAVEALVSVLLEQDRPEDAAALLSSVGPLEQQHAGGAMRAPIMAARGRLALVSGDPRSALGHFLATGRLARDVFGTDNPAIEPWRSEAALAARQLEDHEQAAALAAEELEHARRWGAPRTLAIALRTHAVVLGGSEGVDLAAEAARTAEGGGVVLEQVRALATQGALLRAGRRRTEAQEVLRLALDLAAEHGADAQVRGLRQNLVAAGARPRLVRTRGPNALTAGERRVALLAADGLTNRQIADALFVTPKAVGFHLGNVYRKLDVPGRTHLAEALGKAR